MKWFSILLVISAIVEMILSDHVCPLFHCKELPGEECIEMNLKNNTREINVHPCSEQGYVCDVDKELFNRTNNSRSVCKKRADMYGNRIRYPGELCDSTHKCLDSDCPEDGVCPSKQVGDACNGHLDCGVKSFCHAQEKVCKTSLNRGGYCISDFECKNHQGCFKGHCADYYSLKVGTDLSSTTSEYKDKLCQSGNVVNNKCYALYYDTATMHPNKDHMVECQAGKPNSCNYTSSTGEKVSLACECSYNEEKKGFCQRDIGHEGDWGKLAIYRRRYLMNKCHTMNRFTCRRAKPQHSDKLKEFEIKTVWAHKYYKSPECIKAVFVNEGLYISSVSAYVFLFILYVLFY